METKKEKTLENTVEEHYDQLFDEVMDIVGDDMYDIVVEVKTLEGKTIRISWQDREKRLTEEKT